MNATQIPGFLHKDCSNKCPFFLRSTLRIFFFKRTHAHAQMEAMGSHSYLSLSSRLSEPREVCSSFSDRARGDVKSEGSSRKRGGCPRRWVTFQPVPTC